MIKTILNFVLSHWGYRIATSVILVWLCVSIYDRTQSWESVRDSFMAFVFIWILGRGSADR